MGLLIQNGKIDQCVDGMTLYYKDKTTENLEITIFTQLNSCITYFSEISLQTNSKKTK